VRTLGTEGTLARGRILATVDTRSTAGPQATAMMLATAVTQTAVEMQEPVLMSKTYRSVFANSRKTRQNDEKFVQRKRKE
jgi:hypothetical protein